VTAATMSGPGVAPAAKSMIGLLNDVARRYTDGPAPAPAPARR
jgi:hypothetical protein